ncbi:terpene synthase family protein [Streptomyces syringium]|uniref:terpene synthase family protein n=1 Tax=Streptomyces syringium TaxID=76729 RepID=UPI00345456A1
MCNVFAMQDDALDGAVGPGAQVAGETRRRIVDALHSVNHGEGVACGVPLVDAWADVWQRLVARRSPAWRDRLLLHHDEFWLRGFIRDAHVNRTRTPTALDEYNDMKLEVGGVLPMLDYAEFAGDFELPPWLYQNDVIQRMRRECALAGSYINDVTSVEKDDARGEVSNVVFTLQNEYQCTRTEAIEKALGLIQRGIYRLQRQGAELDPMFTSLGLDEDQRHHVRQYVRGIQDFLVGTFRWQRVSRRYCDHGVLAPHRATYPDEVVAPTAPCERS